MALIVYQPFEVHVRRPGDWLQRTAQPYSIILPWRGVSHLDWLRIQGTEWVSARGRRYITDQYGYTHYVDDGHITPRETVVEIIARNDARLGSSKESILSRWSFVATHTLWQGTQVVLWQPPVAPAVRSPGDWLAKRTQPYSTGAVLRGNQTVLDRPVHGDGACWCCYNAAEYDPSHRLPHLKSMGMPLDPQQVEQIISRAYAPKNNEGRVPAEPEQHPDQIAPGETFFNALNYIQVLEGMSAFRYSK